MAWFDFILALFGHKPPKPQQPSTPPPRNYSVVVQPKTATVTLKPNGDRPIATMTAVLTTAVPPQYLDDYYLFTVPADVPPWGAELEVSAPGYVTNRHDVLMTPQSSAFQPVILVAEAPPHTDLVSGESGRLRREGRDFVGDAGLWRAQGFSSFWMLKLLLEGKDIGSAFDIALHYPCNNIRVFGMLNWDDAKFGPHINSNYYECVEQLLQQAADRNVRIEFECLADAQNLSSDVQREHLRRMAEFEVKYWNLLPSLGNEITKNGIDPSIFSFPTGLFSKGSPTGDDWPPTPPWRWSEFHPGRTSDWPRKLKSAREVEDQLGVPCINTEIMGADETPEVNRRSNTVYEFYEAGVIASLSSCGSTFFCQAGLRSLPLGPVQHQCAVAFYEGMLLIPISVRRWSYTRGGLSECPVEHRDDQAIRTFVQYNGAEAWGIATQPSNGWSLRPVSGWRVAETFGEKGNVFHLVR